MCPHGMHRGNITLLFKESTIQRLVLSYLSACTKFSVKIWVWYSNRWLHLGLFSEGSISIREQQCNMNFIIYQYLPVLLNSILLLTSLFSGITWETYIQWPCSTKSPFHQVDLRKNYTHHTLVLQPFKMWFLKIFDRE